MATGYEERRQKILRFRARIEEDIEYLNKELLYGENSGSTDFARDTALRVRDNLIDCSNEINRFRLTRRGVDLYDSE